MRKTYDYERLYEDHDNNAGVCRVRVYEGPERSVVICTELPKNEGASVTDAAEFIAADLIKEGVLSESPVTQEVRTQAVEKGNLEPIASAAPFVFVEESLEPEHKFSFLWFHSYELMGLSVGGRVRECIGQPEWQPTSRQEVEALIGASLDVGLRLSAHSVAKGEPLTLSISDHPSLLDATSLGLQLFGVEDAETAFRLATTLPAAVRGEELEATLDGANVGASLEVGAVYEVKMLEPTHQQDVLAVLIGGRDFPRTFFRVKADANEPLATAEEVAAAASEIERRREEMFAEPLGDPARPDNSEFRVLMFVERLLLTRYLRVPGVQLIPLMAEDSSSRTPFGIGASDEASIISSTLRRRSWIGAQGSIGPSWAASNSRNRPVMLVHTPRVFATTHECAIQLAHDKRDRLLDLLALHRNASGVPFATAIQKFDAASGRYVETRIYPEVEIYGGNLLGGFLSGENQSMLLGDDRAVASDPLLGFWLSLYREAQAERNLDFAYFRYWNLLEVIAADRIEKGTLVTNLEGHQILKADGKPFDTGGARGRVYELVKRGMQAHGYTEQTFAGARELSVGLWDAVGVWNAFRNATAHHGGFDPDDPNQRTQSWYRRAVDAQKAGAHPSGGQSDPYFRFLEQVAQEVVRWELEPSRGS